MTSYEEAQAIGRSDGHILYRTLYAAGIAVSRVESHINKLAMFDESLPQGNSLNVDEFNGYLNGLATAETEVLDEGVRL